MSAQASDPTQPPGPAPPHPSGAPEALSPSPRTAGGEGAQETADEGQAWDLEDWAALEAQDEFAAQAAPTADTVAAASDAVTTPAVTGAHSEGGAATKHPDSRQLRSDLSGPPTPEAPGEPTAPEPEDRRLPFADTLANYQLSAGAAHVLRSAGAFAADAKPPRAVSTSMVLFAMAQLGRPHGVAYWAGDFLLQAMVADEGRYREVRIGYFAQRGIDKLRFPAYTVEATPGLPSPPGAPSAMTAGVGVHLSRARDLARRTTRGERISGRHLLAAFLLLPVEVTYGAQRRLAELGLDLALLRERLYDWLRGYGDDDEAWRELLLGAASRRQLASYDADSAHGRNLLAIERDIAALATLIASRALQPPLAIGLFGEWGSGKTFFMRELRLLVARRSAHPPASRRRRTRRRRRSASRPPSRRSRRRRRSTN